MTDEALKLQRFKQAVSEETDGQVKQMLDEAKAESEDILHRARIIAEENNRTARSRIRDEAEQRLRREISAAKLEMQRQVLIRREELADEVFSEVREKLAAFRSTDEYRKWLADTVKKCADKYPGKKAVIRLAPADMKLCPEGVHADADKTILLGGTIVGFEGSGIVLDCTFDSQFEAERAAFCNNRELSAARDQEI